MKATKADIKKAKALKEALHNLQSRLYFFSHYLEEKGLAEEGQLVTDAGFELDVSHIKMDDCIYQLTNS